MAGTKFNYVSEQRLLYFTQKLKQKFPTATDFIDDVTAAANKMYSSNKVNTLLEGKVDVEEGKGLSTNDFETKYKNQLDNLDLTDIIDDNSTNTDKTWSASKIMSALSELTGLQFVKIEPDAEGNYALPETGSNGNIYLMPNNGANPNSYDEYIWLGSGTYEKIGTTDIDLSHFVSDDDMIEITTEKIDDIFKTVWGETPTE